jgi:hypothetical protein
MAYKTNPQGARVDLGVPGSFRFNGLAELVKNTAEETRRAAQKTSSAETESHCLNSALRGPNDGVHLMHFPPGTSKWNKLEHRLFSFLSSNWRGEPLRDYETIVSLIANTTTAKGLQVKCRLDRRKYPTGRRVSDEERKHVNLKRNTFHGDWNYVIQPNS